MHECSKSLPSDWKEETPLTPITPRPTTIKSMHASSTRSAHKSWLHVIHHLNWERALILLAFRPPTTKKCASSTKSSPIKLVTSVPQTWLGRRRCPGTVCSQAAPGWGSSWQHWLGHTTHTPDAAALSIDATPSPRLNLRLKRDFFYKKCYGPVCFLHQHKLRLYAVHSIYSCCPITWVLGILCIIPHMLFIDADQ